MSSNSEYEQRQFFNQSVLVEKDGFIYWSPEWIEYFKKEDEDFWAEMYNGMCNDKTNKS